MIRQSLTSPASSASQLGVGVLIELHPIVRSFPQWVTNSLHIGTKEMQMLAYLGDVIRGVSAMCLGRGMKCCFYPNQLMWKGIWFNMLGHDHK